jgi:hypothetical protein
MATVPADTYALIANFDPNNDLGAIERELPGISKIVSDQNKPGEAWWQTAERALTGLAATYYQTQILRTNIERAKQGLPPLTGTDLPATTVAVGLSRDTQNLLLIVGGGLLLGLLLLRRK